MARVVGAPWRFEIPYRHSPAGAKNGAYAGYQAADLNRREVMKNVRQERRITFLQWIDEKVAGAVIHDVGDVNLPCQRTSLLQRLGKVDDR
jgi:hypothetical protein